MFGVGGVDGYDRGMPMTRTRSGPQEVEFGARCVALLLFTFYVIRLWFALDPQPGPMTEAVSGVSEETFSGYVLVLGVFLYGTFMLLRYLARSVLAALHGSPGVIAKILAAGTLGLVLAAIVTGRLAELTGCAVLAAMALNWVLEAGGARRHTD